MNPAKKPLEDLQEYFYPDHAEPDGYRSDCWLGTEADKCRLKNNQIFLTKEEAQEAQRKQVKL